ncbi:putative Fe2OG dioxygenase domain-containing protein [Seiridium unicorne]|uniref:Fe2OG dioxygenase domain-containing protein n=1 Tax=Seiridium unicorne TaxID=138068 RepID=A0ABR2UMZ1_9PEZI
MGVPLLDASRLQGGPDERKAHLQDLIQSFKDYGFARLKNHGIAAKSVNQIFEQAAELFHLDTEEKLKFANIADGSPQRGYSAVGVEKTAPLYGNLIGRSVDEKLTDAREHFDCGSPLDTEFVNRWPNAVEGFQQHMESFYFEMERATSDILACLEEGLQAPAGTFNRLITREKNASELRLNHYPPVPVSVLQSGQVSRIWPHFDLGVITLLFASSVGGLEVEDRKVSQGKDKTFIPVEPESEGELIVNISETLQRWTDDQLPAGLHRVSIPRDQDATEVPGRYSIAYLCKADRQAPVGTIADFQTGEKPRYLNMTASEYHRSRLLTAY